MEPFLGQIMMEQLRSTWVRGDCGLRYWSWLRLVL